MNRTLLTLASLGLAVATGSAHATIMFSPTNSPSGDEQTIQFEAQAMLPALTQTGDTNQTMSPVIFNTLTNQMIAADGMGQANIVCVTNCLTGVTNKPQLTSLEMRAGPGTAWTDVVANPDFGEGTMQVAVTDQMGATFDFVLTNGSNFFTLTAINNEVITDVQMTQETGTAGPFGWNDFKQPRVSGVCTLVGTTCTPIPTLEPSSLAILGGALLSLGLWYRRRSA
jgi:hypothetical protein